MPAVMGEMFSNGGCCGIRHFWGRRSMRQKTIIWITSGFILIGAIIAAIVCGVHFSNFPPACWSNECLAESNRMKSYMNLKVNPCDDFYEFACGNFGSVHSIPENLSRYETFNMAHEHVLQTLKMEFESIDDDDPIPIQVYKTIYQLCRDDDSYHNLQGLRWFLTQMGGFPAANIPMKGTYLDAMRYLITHVGPDGLVDVEIGPNLIDNSKNVINVYQPGFLIGKNDLIDKENTSQSKELVASYKKYMKQAIVLLDTKPEEKSGEGLDVMIDKMIDFEKSLLKFSTPPEERGNLRDTIENVTLGSMAPFTIGDQTISWLDFVQNIFNDLKLNITLTSEEEVSLADKNYMTNLPILLSASEPEVIMNYLGWLLVSRFAFTNRELYLLEFEQHRVKLGVTQPKMRDKMCIQHLTTSAPQLVGRMYVDRSFSPDDKEAAEMMIHYVIDAFKGIVQRKDWMDQPVIDEALLKANSVRLHIGYPDWIKNDTTLSNIFNLTDPYDGEKKASLYYLLYLQRYLIGYNFGKLREQVDKSLWFMGPSEVNAAFNMQQNSMTIPAAILQGVFFQRNRPKYLNYGGIGSIIGHEITHGFDDYGAQFDHQGNLRNWWSNRTLDRFKNVSECFIQQYESIYDADAEMNLNGKANIGENIADNGGIREAYFAYLMDRNETMSKLEEGTSTHDFLPLPYMDFTDEQLFFLGYAHSCCGLIRKEKLRSSIYDDPHAPTKYRVNVPLKNLDQFSQVFKCPINSNMNPEKKCILW